MIKKKFCNTPSEILKKEYVKAYKKMSCSNCNHYMRKDNCNGGYCMRWQKSPRFISCTEANNCNEYFNGEDTIRYAQD